MHGDNGFGKGGGGNGAKEAMAVNMERTRTQFTPEKNNIKPNTGL